MSPEQHHDASELPQEKPYLDEAKHVIDRAVAAHPQTTERFKIIDAYVDRILADAASGKVTGKDGHVYTFEDCIDRFKVFLDEYSRPPGQDGQQSSPYLKIPSIGGLRASLVEIMKTGDLATSLVGSMKLHIEAHEAMKNKELDQTWRADTVEDMSEEAVESSGVISVPAWSKDATLEDTGPTFEFSSEPEKLVFGSTVRVVESSSEHNDIPSDRVRILSGTVTGVNYIHNEADVLLSDGRKVVVPASTPENGIVDMPTAATGHEEVHESLFVGDESGAAANIIDLPKPQLEWKKLDGSQPIFKQPKK